MPKHSLNKPNEVRGDYTIAKGRLTFTTEDAALPTRLEIDKRAGRQSAVWLLQADPLAEFVGVIDTCEQVRVERPQQWRVTMRGRIKAE